MWILLLTLLVACGDDDAYLCDTSYQVTWEGWGDGFFSTYCRSCHSSTTEERNGAPEGVDFDTLDDVILWLDSIERVVLDEGSMPVGGGVYEDDLLLLEALLKCEL